MQNDPHSFTVYLVLMSEIEAKCFRTAPSFMRKAAGGQCGLSHFEALFFHQSVLPSEYAQ